MAGTRPASLENYIIANKTFPAGMFEGIRFTITRTPRFAESTNLPEWMADMMGV
jgi:hypothetical protein